MKSKEPKFRGLEVLVFTEAPKDAELTVQVLSNAGFNARSVTNVSRLLDALLGAGAVIVSEESLNRRFLERLKARIDAQPHWSDLPIITVTSDGSSTAESIERLEWMATFLQNVTLVERPIRLATLITIIRTALSSRKKQFEIKTLWADLEKSKLLAEEASRAKSMFLANMSHEIRTPLAAILGFTSLLRDEGLPSGERTQFLDVIARNGDQLSGLINDILDLSKVESGKLEIEKHEISLPDFFAELTSWLRPMVEAKGLSFVVKVPTPGLSEIINADSTRIRQVLLNLVSNSVKFTKTGSVEVALQVEPMSAGHVLIRFEVKDSGIGMSSEDQTRIFRPFSQADTSMTRKYGGTGLGLVLSRALAKAMNGDLRLLHTELGQGSTFEFYFQAEIKSSSQAATNEKSASEGLLSERKILLVEDSPDNQFLMTRYLNSMGAEITNAENGKVAVELALQREFDVVLMDIQMPVMDGLSATRELRRRKYSKPIIALTAHALREERDRSLRAGCDYHLTKPVSRQGLMEAVSACLNERRCQKEA